MEAKGYERKILKSKYGHEEIWKIEAMLNMSHGGEEICYVGRWNREMS